MPSKRVLHFLFMYWLQGLKKTFAEIHAIVLFWKLYIGLCWNVIWAFVIMRRRDLNKIGSIAYIVKHKIWKACANWKFFPFSSFLWLPLYESASSRNPNPFLCSLIMRRVVDCPPLYFKTIQFRKAIASANELRSVATKEGNRLAFFV